MSPKTHLCAGLMAAAICCQYAPHHTIEIVVGALCTANMPDIDQDVKLLRHRGQTHSLIWPMILYIVSQYPIQGRYIVLGMAIGWLSHLICDLLNGKGIEAIWPLSKANFRIADIKYDGAGERVIMYICIIGIVVNMVGYNNIKIIAEVLR